MGCENDEVEPAWVRRTPPRAIRESPLHNEVCCGEACRHPKAGRSAHGWGQAPALQVLLHPVSGYEECLRRVAGWEAGFPSFRRDKAGGIAIDVFPRGGGAWTLAFARMTKWRGGRPWLGTSPCATLS